MAGRAAVEQLVGMPIVRAKAPLGFSALRHFLCGLTIGLHKEFREADCVYTRNLWVAWLTVLFGQKVIFDHYRPWADQIPPLQLWTYCLFCNRRFILGICHSEYTRDKYLALGIPGEKLRCVYNGFEPQRFSMPIQIEDAKRQIGLDPARKTVVYTGRVNRKKGLNLVIEAAKHLAEIDFVLVGSYGIGLVEGMVGELKNVHIVPWQTSEGLMPYIFAADILLVPPSSQPLAEFGSTVLPLKLFLYLGSGRPILAGDTPDVREVLRTGENSHLCKVDDLDSLLEGIRRLANDSVYAARLAATALADSRAYTWSARAEKIIAAISERINTVSVERGHWGSAQFRTWLAQSSAWLVHLVRKRSWVLPARVVPAPTDAVHG
jgi:glycosyltransferase involved in cell wall biosynthesis